MAVNAVAYKNAFGRGGSVDIEDDDCGRCTIVASDTLSLDRLRQQAAKKLRAMAAALDAECGKAPKAFVETHSS